MPLTTHAKIIDGVIMQRPKMTYAVKDGKLVHVSAVVSGLACGCICPACGGILEAKKGNCVVHHFAHYKINDCATDYEASLHMLAKEIIAEAKAITIPAVYVFGGNPDWIISESRKIPVDAVVLETAIGEIIPDIQVFSGSRTLLIEIKVTHGIDGIKLERIKKLGLSCIEIDISKQPYEITKKLLSQLLLTNPSSSRWIYNVYSARYKQFFLDQLLKVRLERHGCALHAMGCPRNVRIWHGKHYANVLNDCSSCEYYFDTLYNDDEPVFLRCSAKLKYHTFQGLKKAISSKS